MRLARRACVLASVIAALAAAAAGGTASASLGDSLYGGPGHRPGPDLLYAPAAHSPQLENGSMWRASPILVSGATAYRSGEFLYQDFLYDDHGAASGLRDPGDPRPTGHTFAQPNGFYLYPSDPAYAENAADLVEFRVKPISGATAFRITLNTLNDPSLVGMTIAIGGGADPPREYPHGANVTGLAKRFLTVHGTTAELINAADGSQISPDPQVSVNQTRRQIKVVVPHSAWNPHRHSIRFAIGVGLWDEANDRYLLPQQARTQTAPGGAGTLADPPAFFNVGFRPDEPYPEVTDPVGTAQSPAWWRDKLQGEALAEGDLAQLFAQIKFGKLRDRVRDDRGVPRRGPLNRILVSNHEAAPGVDYDVSCLANSDDCEGPYQGRLQPYAIYVPHGDRPADGWGTTLLLHSLGASFNQYSDSNHQRQFGERGGGSVVITPEARGPDGSYDSHALADVFEVWNDVARRYMLDPDWTVASGYSMGAIGTFKIAQQFPDLFSRAQPTVGFEGTTYREASLRNIPVLMWNGLADELVNPALFTPTAQQLDSLDYRYELDVFHPGEHLSLAINDEYQPAADFLGTAKVNRNPFHVTYVLDPAIDESDLGIVADHAYWLRDLELRSAGHGTLDAVSKAFGRDDPTPSSTQAGAGALPGGSLLDPYPFTSTKKTWGPTPDVPKQNRIVIDAENIASMKINPGRARVGCGVALEITTDGPLTVRIGGGCNRVVQAG